MLVSCRKCGASASDKAEACPKCGAGAEAMLGLAKPCPECAQTVREGFPSCPACGLPAASFGAFHKFANAMSPTPPGSPPPPAPPPQPADLMQTSKQPPAPQEKSGAGGLVAVIAVVGLVGAIMWGMWQANQTPAAPQVAETETIPPPAEAAAEPAAPPALSADEQAEQDMLNDPISGAFFREFKSLFPDDYAQLFLPALSEARFLSTTELRERLFNRMVDFQARNLSALMSADSYSLADLADRSSEAMSTPRICEVVVGGDFSGLDYVDPAGQQALIEQDLALIRAIASGRSSGSPRGDPTEDQEMAFERGLSDRLTETEMDAVRDGSVESMAPEDQCPIVSAIWDTVAAMPTDASAFWTAQLFKAGLESPPPH